MRAIYSPSTDMTVRFQMCWQEVKGWRGGKGLDSFKNLGLTVGYWCTQGNSHGPQERSTEDTIDEGGSAGAISPRTPINVVTQTCSPTDVVTPSLRYRLRSHAEATPVDTKGEAQSWPTAPRLT